MERYVFKSVKGLLGIALGCILFLLLFISNIKYRFKKDFLFSNITIVIMLLIFVLSLYLKKKNIKIIDNKVVKHFNNNIDKWVIILTILLFVWQSFVAYNIFFLTGWDVNGILVGANAMAKGDTETLAGLTSYFSIYPNNLFITYLYAIIFKIVGSIAPKYCIISLVGLNCIINSYTCYLVYKVARFFVSKKVAFIGYILVVMSIGLSSWVVITYTDSLALFVPILGFYLYKKPLDNKKKIVRYIYRIAAISILTIGYFIKPQCAIMLIAIIIIELLYMCKGFSVRKLKRFGVIVITIIISIVGVKSAYSYGENVTKLKIKSEKEFGMTHFLMMSFNEKNQGVYAHEDVIYSASFDTKKERKKANIERFKERIKDMGVSGVLTHTKKKMLVVFNDGTFAWGDEGGFYYKLYDSKNKITQFLKSACYNGEMRYIYYSSMQQFVWITILLFAFISCFINNKFKRKKAIDILWLALIGLIFYELIFEARARYLYIYVPIFSVVATVGIDLIVSRTEKVKIASKQSDR